MRPVRKNGVVPDLIVNEKPRPRIVLHIVSDELRERLLQLRPWPGTIHEEAPSLVQWDEHDVLITDSGIVSATDLGRLTRSVPARIPVLRILHESAADGWTLDISDGDPDGDLPMEALHLTGTDGGRQLVLPGDLDRETLADAQQLIQAFERRTLRSGIGQWGVTSRGETFDRPFMFSPIVRGANDVMLIGTYKRGVDGVTNWVLPADVDLRPWIRLAFERWAVELPEQFPTAPGWHHGDPWATSVEREALNTIHAADAALREAQEEHDAIVAAARAALDTARSAVDEGLRRLLTEDGDALVEAVIDAFNILGFTSTNMDEVYQAGQRHEDLQLRDGDSDWLALVEVTGTQRGVNQEKWRKLVTHLTAYLRGEGAVRGAVPWLVVNQQRGHDPAARGELWQRSFRDDVAETLGLGIESPALYVLASRVQDGALDAARARDALRGSTGAFTLTEARAVH